MNSSNSNSSSNSINTHMILTSMTDHMEGRSIDRQCELADLVDSFTTYCEKGGEDEGVFARFLREAAAI